LSSLYVTFDTLDPNTGAGKVCLHEIEALGTCSDLKGIIARGDPANLRATGFPAVKPRVRLPLRIVSLEKVYPFNPFLYDYFTAEQLDGTVDLLHMSCSPGVALLAKLRPKHSVCNIVAHDLKTSIEEHLRIAGTEYPFIHNTDPYLHDTLIKHAKLVDCVFTPSHGSEKWINENIKPKRVEVIPHGCDYPETPPPLPQGIHLGYMGASGPDKGLLYLLLAWDKLALKDAELVLAGPCCEGIDSWIQRFCPTAKIRKLGWVGQPADFFKEVNVCVVPSVTEGFGLLGLESMAHGRSVIASTGAGCSDLVVDGKDGFTVPPRDPRAIVEAVRNYGSNPKYVAQMGRTARTKAKRYTWDKIEQIYQRIYREVME
jgi:glycosyltransferase involved in cell wall biosynthesis